MALVGIVFIDEDDNVGIYVRGEPPRPAGENGAPTRAQMAAHLALKHLEKMGAQIEPVFLAEDGPDEGSEKRNGDGKGDSNKD